MEIQRELNDLIRQSERNEDFRPKAHLIIQSDKHETASGGLRLSITNFAYNCLLQYFDPYRDAPSVTWIDRSQLIKHVMVSVMEDHHGCVSNYIDSMLRTKEKLNNTEAILFLSPDAKSFVDVHTKSLFQSLAVILKTTVDKILIMDISKRPSSIV